MSTARLPITDLRRNFGNVTSLLEVNDSITITKKGVDIATLIPSLHFKREILKKTAGTLKGSSLDNDNVWDDILTRKSRKKATRL